MTKTTKRNNPNKIPYLAGFGVLAVFALLHFLDTRSGALVSGDHWLMGNYLIVALAAFLGVGAAGWFLLSPFSDRKYRLEWAFLSASLIFGTTYLFVLPPLSGPDEARHYASAYQLSNQILGIPASGEDGLVFVREEDWFAEDPKRTYVPIVSEDGSLTTDEAGAKEAEILGQVLTEETYRLIHEKGFSMEEPRSDGGNGMARSIHHAVVTTPMGYLAPALGISLARILHLNSLWLMYLGRFMNLLLYTAAVTLALRRLPFGKEVLFGVALLPMTMHLTTTFSYDVLLLSGMFYFTAHCLYLAYEAETVRNRDILLLAAIMAAAGPCKMVYTVLMGLCLLIPVRKFGGWKRWTIAAACVLAAWAAAMIAINAQTVASYTGGGENFITWAGEPGYTLGALFHQPVKMIQLFYQTLVWQGEYWFQTMIGAWLGNVDLVLDVPFLLVLTLGGCLALLSLRKPGESLKLTGGRRAWAILLCLACGGAVMMSMLLSWTPVSSKVICGVQGRYFLPFLPLFLMACKNDTVVLTKNQDRSILYLMCCANGYVLMRIFSIVSMRL